MKFMRLPVARVYSFTVAIGQFFERRPLTVAARHASDFSEYFGCRIEIQFFGIFNFVFLSFRTPSTKIVFVVDFSVTKSVTR